MVYFLSETENKYMTMCLRPRIRSNPVPEELRGWNWHTPPLKPYYEIKLPMYAVCSNYCKTARDVYLTFVENVKGEENINISLGKAIHKTVAGAVRAAKHLEFDVPPPKVTAFQDAIKEVWEYTLSECKTAFLRAKSEQPYASEEDILATSIPFLVEHRMDGALLGCSGLISVDCYDYMKNIIFDIKVTSSPNELNRLYTTGYALVMESIYEIPVDIGCIVNISFINGRMNISRDIHYIDANLRSRWVEERDRKAEIVYEGRDTGIPEECYQNCMFRHVCSGGDR